MALVLVSGLRGGVGVTAVAANLAMTMAAAGQSTVVLDLSRASTLGMHFGLDPCQPLPGFDAPAAAAGPVHGVRLLDAGMQAASGDLGEGLASGDFDFAGDVFYIADLSGADRSATAQLRPHADLELCLLTPSAECLYTLPSALEQSPETVLFALNRCDDTRRLGRHVSSFVRELLGDRLVGIIHADEAVPEAAAMMQPLSRHSPASAALADIASLADLIAALPAAARPAQSADPRPGVQGHAA